MPESGAAPRPPQIVLAFDFGLRRIGVATGNTVSSTATPLTTLDARDGVPDWAQLTQLVRTQGATHIVIGRPYNFDGSAHALGPASDRFAAELAQRCRQPVSRVDERYSSVEAEATLIRARQTGQRRKLLDRKDIDSHAAAAILERWLAGEGQTN